VVARTALQFLRLCSEFTALLPDICGKSVDSIKIEDPRSGVIQQTSDGPDPRWGLKIGRPQRYELQNGGLRAPVHL